LQVRKLALDIASLGQVKRYLDSLTAERDRTDSIVWPCCNPAAE